MRTQLALHLWRLPSIYNTASFHFTANNIGKAGKFKTHMPCSAPLLKNTKTVSFKVELEATARRNCFAVDFARLLDPFACCLVKLSHAQTQPSKSCQQVSLDVRISACLSFSLSLGTTESIAGYHEMQCTRKIGCINHLFKLTLQFHERNWVD